jgi:hypothetical protein
VLFGGATVGNLEELGWPGLESSPRREVDARTAAKQFTTASPKSEHRRPGSIRNPGRFLWYSIFLAALPRNHLNLPGGGFVLRTGSFRVSGPRSRCRRAHLPDQILHSTEENVFYSALRAHSEAHDLVQHAQGEHKKMAELLEEMADLDPQEEDLDAVGATAQRSQGSRRGGRG